MYEVTKEYLESMNKSVRMSSSMKIIFSFANGDVTFTDDDIVGFTESKTAHLVAGELPTIETTIELKNLDGLFNPNDTTNSPNYHDQLAEGVKITYWYGYNGVPKIKPLGYEGDESDEYEPVYGMEDSGIPQYKYYTDEGYETIPAEAYGFLDGYTTEWVKGGEVYSDGDLSYDESSISVTITAYDALSLIDDSVYYSFSGSTTTLGDIAKNVIGLTDYPEDDEGNKKIVIADSLYNIETSVSVAGSSSDATTAKTWLQDIAYAGGVKMYIDRDGYLHLDNDPETRSASQYHLTLDNQSENPTHAKYQLPATLTIESSSDYVSDVEVTVGGGGEDLTISGNPYIITSTRLRAIRDRLLADFIPYRNEADIVYRGEPALDILDPITFDADFAEDLTGQIVESEISYDGGLSGSLLIRYEISATTPTSVEVTGSNNFNYMYGSEYPTVASITLTCTTDATLPTYQWYYYSNGAWVKISGETNSTYEIAYDDYDFDSIVKFKCVVSDSIGAIASIVNIYETVSETASYKGVVEGNNVADIEATVTNPEVGDTVLLDNTNDSGASTYGETYVYNGETWESTEASDSIADTYKDALALAENSGKTIHTAEIYTDLLVANKAFISKLTTEDLLLNSGGAIRSEYYNKDGSINEEVADNIKAGAYLGANGQLKAYYAEIINAYLSGKLVTSSLETFDAKPDIDEDWGLSQDMSNDASWATPFTVGDRYWNGITYGDDKFVTVGYSGWVSYSNDGINWATPFTVGDRYWNGITYGDGKFVAVGLYSAISYSNDGINWATPFTVGTTDWYGITYGDGKFVAVGGAGTISYSNNGINWAPSFKVGTRAWNSITYGDGKFVAVGYYGWVSYSTDGITWATPFRVGSEYWPLNSYEQFVAVWRSIAVNSSGRFVAVGDGGYVSYSNDGINWATPFKVGTTDWYGITYGDGKFVTVGYSGGYVSYSTDGITWAPSFKVGTRAWNSITYGDGKFVAVGNDGYVSYSNMSIVRNIYDYLTTLLDTLTAPSGTDPSTGEPYTLPNTEPLLYSTYVNGMAIYKGTPYTLAKLKVANNEISFTDDTGVTVYIRVVPPSWENLQITGLTIIGASEENHVTALIPKDGNGTGYVGSDGKRFAEVWADKVYGAVFN